MCTVKLRHKDKCVTCRFFLGPGDRPALLGMPDLKLLSILRITCDVIGKPHESRKVDSQTMEMSISPSCRTNEAPQIWQICVITNKGGKQKTKEPLNEELGRLQRQQIIVTLGMDKTSKWCNSFMLVPKANGKV